MKNIFTNRPSSKESSLFLRSILFFITFLLVSKNSAFSQNSVAVVIDPAATSVLVNQTFTVDVKVDFGTGSVAAVDAYVNFDPLDLEVTATPTVPASTQTALSGVSVNFNTVANMNALGQVDHGRFTTAPIASHPNADFVLFTISFRALRVPPGGTTSITFNTVPARQTLAVENGLPILSGTSPGTVTISAVGCTPPSATISAPGGTITCNSQPFNLTLASAPVGTAPFDLTIAGPAGTATYNDIAVGGIITNFVPPVSKIWPDPVSPLPGTDEDAAYTLGVKFSSSVNGFVKGVRFFGADEVVGTASNYTGQLWSVSGDLLASGVFAGVTADSWNELSFTTPVYITAGTVYIASYNTNASIKYAVTPNGLVSAVTNGSLTALANGGVYNTGSAVVFPGIPPIGGTTNHNYWVDVMFSPNVYTFNLTGVKDANECTSTGALQTLVVTSVDCSTLPVSLLNLSATPKDKSINLHWSTASEINNQGFEIQRRTDASEWKVIGFVNGAGNSFVTRHYDYTDQDLSSGRYYYRLRQVDIDGRYEFSPVVSAIIGGTESFKLDQNYPNPFRSETILRFSLPQKANVKLSIFDLHGRLIKVLVNGSRDRGTHAVTFNASALNSGVYYYKLETDNFSAVKKMTVQ